MLRNVLSLHILSSVQDINSLGKCIERTLTNLGTRQVIYLVRFHVFTIIETQAFDVGCNLPYAITVVDGERQLLG